MQTAILQRIARACGIPDLPEILSQRLSGADLNTLLLEVFRQKAQQRSASELLHAYRSNRFVRPAALDALDFKAFCLDALSVSRQKGFQPIQLSPLSPLGTCSVLATAHQDKIIAACRGVEVVADATNVLAMESVLRRSEQQFPAAALHFSTTHRHVRAQEVPDLPGFSAHFEIMGLTSAGRDTGSFQFEKESVLLHFQLYKTYLEETLQLPPVAFRLKFPDGETRFSETMLSFLQKTAPEYPLEHISFSTGEQAYYQDLQFKVVLSLPGSPALEIADGGFTDWTQQLSANRKERFLISGIGLELLYKITKGGL